MSQFGQPKFHVLDSHLRRVAATRVSVDHAVPGRRWVLTTPEAGWFTAGTQVLKVPPAPARAPAPRLLRGREWDLSLLCGVLF